MLLLVVVGVVLAVWQPWRAAGDTPAAATSPSPSPDGGSPSPTPSGSPSAAATPTPDATASEDPAPSPDPSATIAVCTSGDIVVTAITDKGSYGAGEKPQLSISLVNNGDVDCAMDVGTAAQTFTVASGTDTWWRSTDCQKEPSNQFVTLAPGRVVTSVEPLVWDRTRSAVGTCTSDRPQAQPGYYNLTVSIGGIESEPRQFELR